jgi:zinc protease
MTRPRRLPLALLAALAATGPAPADAPAPRPPPTSSPSLAPAVPFEEWTLPNGLEVILHEDHSLPLVAVNLWYHVGPANEPRGRSGFAHLFEHLMFEGSRHVGAELDRLLEAAGATNVNGTTSWDRTNYFETVPREHLELVLWIESDRMGFMIDSLAEARLDVQRGVVKNERRQSYENAPYGPSALALYDALFPEGHPYHGAVIGSMRDLDAATMADVRAFFEKFYAPSNATLALAGDVASADARRLVARWFGTLPARPRPARAGQPTAPLAAPLRVTVKEPVELARVAMGWIAPAAYSDEDYALSVAAAVLAGGKATRLYRKLVVEQQLAAEVAAEVDANQLASIVVVSATASSGVAAAKLEPALDDALAELARDGPTPAELARAKRRLLLALHDELQLLNGRGGESGRAGLLQRFHHYLGDAGYLSKHLARLEGVGAREVKDAVGRQLGRERRAVVVTEPTGKP